VKRLEQIRYLEGALEARESSERTFSARINYAIISRGFTSGYLLSAAATALECALLE